METARIAAPRGNKLPELHRRGLNSISLPFFLPLCFDPAAVGVILHFLRVLVR